MIESNVLFDTLENKISSLKDELNNAEDEKHDLMTHAENKFGDMIQQLDQWEEFSPSPSGTRLRYRNNSRYYIDISRIIDYNGIEIISGFHCWLSIDVSAKQDLCVFNSNINSSLLVKSVNEMTDEENEKVYAFKSHPWNKQIWKILEYQRANLEQIKLNRDVEATKELNSSLRKVLGFTNEIE